MSQNTLFDELLSVTNNVVRALDKTSSSGSGGGTPRAGTNGRDNDENRPPDIPQQAEDNSKSSADSGVGKTVTQSDAARDTRAPLAAVVDSDDSTTASEVLIRSTLVDHASNRPVSLNSSASSQGSRSRDLDNFNVADAKKVKVSKKQLREIVSPRDSYDNASQPGLLSRQAQSGQGQADLNVNNNSNPKSTYKPESGKVINGSFPFKEVPSVNHAKDAWKYSESSKVFKEQKKFLSQGVAGSVCSSNVVYTVQRHERQERDVKGPSAKKQLEADTGIDKTSKASQQFSHFPYKVSKQGSAAKEQVLVEPEDQAEHWDEQSISSSQPEIVTVEERVVNISSQALMLSDLEDSDSASQAGAVDVVSAANHPARPQSFPNPRPKGVGLRQGALTQGGAMSKAGKGDEVQISKFSLSDKQREIREALSKRGHQSKPVRRVVQPHVVHSATSSVDGDLNKNNNMDPGEETATAGGSGSGAGGNMQSITAAVAASAAVAATQPFLKMQQEMENRMQALLAEIDRVQKQVTSGEAGAGTVNPVVGQQQQQQRPGGSNPRKAELERQEMELTERRLQHMETLQSQQMQLQAQLLSISQGMSRQPPRPQPTSLLPPHHPTYFPTTSHHPAMGGKAQYDRGLIERELMRGRLQGQQQQQQRQQDRPWLSSSIPKDAASDLTESAFDTPNPRSKQPRPAQFGAGKVGLLQEILAAESSPQLNTTFTAARTRRGDGGSPVQKARKLVQDLSTLQDQTADSIWSEPQPRMKGKRRMEEPAPLDYYLKQVRDSKRSSSPSKTGGRRQHQQAPVTAQDDKYQEAKQVLSVVSSERQTLENNLDLMLRNRPDMDIFSLMLSGTGGHRTEAARIKKMVEKRISAMDDGVKREVAWDLQNPPSKSSSSQDMGVRGRAATRGAGGGGGGGGVKARGVGFGSGAPRMSRVDSGLHKSRSAPDTMALARKGGKGATNIIRAKPAPKRTQIAYNDEAVMTQIYGKAYYQKGRTTVKDPYLHYQNTAKPRSPRRPSPTRPDGVVNVRSANIQAVPSSSSIDSASVSASHGQGGPPRQFYFSPTRGYVPIASSSAPMGGQLVPMAVPLGRPRMDPGLALGPDNQPLSGSVPVARAVVSAATNVAVVSINADPDQQQRHRDRGPMLEKQVLPPVDIDTPSPCTSPREGDAQMKKSDAPRNNAGYLQTFHYQEEDEEEDEDSEANRTLTEAAASEDESQEEQQGTGISLPGYHQPNPAPAADPSQILDRALRLQQSSSRPLDRAPPAQLREQGEVGWEGRCDDLADDLRRRDLLQNKAREWVEHELMARLLLKVYPMMAEHGPGAVTDPVEEGLAQAQEADAESIPDDESLLVGDTIGQRGLQLFIDAGKPVNNQLVNALVREVIAEKVGGMLGRRQEVDSAFQDPAKQAREATARGGKMTMEEEEETEVVRASRQSDHRQQHQQPVPTPQPTPPSTSPVPGYLSSHNAPATPPLTPPPPPLPPRERSPVKDISSASSMPATVAAPVAMVSAATSITPPLVPAPQLDSDTEVSASLDISEELRVLDNKLKQAQALPPPGSTSLHDIRTPTPTPPPTPPPAQPAAPTTTTPPPSPPVHPVGPPAPVEERQVESSATVQPQVSPRKREPSSRSPQPWGDPDSPGPELNPSFEDQAASTLAHPQPQPLVMSVAVGTETGGDKRRSPSPQRRRHMEDSSELDSVSDPSSATDTFNENISEGQWLVDRSEGQVAGLPLDQELHRRAVDAVRGVDTSTASTLRDTEDLDMDDPEEDASHSEGEFLHKGVDLINPETDPVLAYLMAMQTQPGGYPRHYNMAPQHVQQVLSATSQNSEGEITRNGGRVQAPGGFDMMRKSMGEISEGQLYAGGVGGGGGGGGGVTVVTPKVASPPPQERDPRSRHQGEGRGVNRARSESPVKRQPSNPPRSKTPPGTQTRKHQQQYQPVRSGMPPSHSRRPLKSALVRTSEESRQSWNSDPDSDNRRGGLPTTEYGTRTLTPDQLNTEALLQSGTYITRSMNSSGRQGSTKKSVEFDLTGTYEMSRRNSYRSDDGFTSTAGSSNNIHISGSDRSLGLRYSFEDSETVDERLPRSSSLRVSVTMPSMEGGSESDVSEIDLSEGTGH